MKTNSIAKSVDDYIARFPAKVQTRLRKIRATIRKTAPEAAESISYQMPAYKLHGRVLIYFAGYEKHIGLYPAPREAPKFNEALAEYEGGKGTVRLPLDEPLPFHLIARIVAYRARLCRQAESRTKPSRPSSSKRGARPTKKPSASRARRKTSR